MIDAEIVADHPGEMKAKSLFPVILNSRKKAQKTQKYN